MPASPPAPTATALPTRPIPRPGILAIEAYVPGESKVAGGLKPAKLSSNETPLGASPKAIAAYRAGAETLERYPDGSASGLRQAIASAYGINADRIVCGAGSDEILQLVAKAYLGPGDEAIYTEHGFLVYRIAILACGATPVVAPERDFHTDVDAILARVTPATRIVFVANPNNPTGTFVPVSEVRRLRASLPGNVLLVLDAAYCEYVRRNDYEAGFELVATTDNTIMARTFSKLHGLAALRLGWGYGPPEVIDVINRIRGPFNVSAPAIAAGIAAIQDTAHQDLGVAHNDRWLPVMTAALTKLGLTVTPSVGNFVLAHLPATPGRDASAADAFLKSRGILVRRVTAYGLPNALRITLGTADENERVIAALAEFFARR